MKLKIPPPLLFLCCLGIIRLLPTTLFTSDTLVWVIGGLFIAGLSIALLNLWAFWQTKTPLNPQRIEMTSTLVTTGIFRISRNPMYLSLTLWLLAWSLFCGTFWGLLVVVAFVVYLTEFQIKPEEQFLAQKFGQAYLEYKQSVRRWI